MRERPTPIPGPLRLPAAGLLLALAGCASQARIADAEVRMSDRPECRHQRGVAAESSADPARGSGTWGDCRDARATLWRTQRAGEPVDFRRDRGDE